MGPAACLEGSLTADPGIPLQLDRRKGHRRKTRAPAQGERDLSRGDPRRRPLRRDLAGLRGVDRLLPSADDGARHRALALAAQHGHVEIVVSVRESASCASYMSHTFGRLR